MNGCTLIPVYRHGATVAGVIEGLAKSGRECIVVDDGNDAETRARLAALPERFPFVRVLHLPENGGKGAALRAGFRYAAELGMTHVVHLDADGQHDPADAARFFDAMAAQPEALVVGRPVFDASVPANRLLSRQLSVGLVWLATLSRAIRDPLCGFRGVPLAPTLRLCERVPTGDHMEFEPELAVRLVWDGVPVVNLPVPVVYPEGGVSNFDVVRDDLRLAGLYARLVLGMVVRAPGWLLHGRGR